MADSIEIDSLAYQLEVAVANYQATYDSLPQGPENPELRNYKRKREITFVPGDDWRNPRGRHLARSPGSGLFPIREHPRTTAPSAPRRIRPLRLAAPAPAAPRRIIGMQVAPGIYETAAAILGTAIMQILAAISTWVWNAPAASGNSAPIPSPIRAVVIDAVETDGSGRKRRAVDASPRPQAPETAPSSLPASPSPPSITERAEKTQTQTFAAESQVPTPPVSRPTSSGSDHDSPKTMALSHAQLAQRGIERFRQRQAAGHRAPDAPFMKKWAKEQVKNTLTSPHKDAEIEALISKARKIAIESPKQKQVRESRKLKKQRDIEAQESDRETKRRAQEEKENARLKEQAEQEARLEAEALQKQAEEAAKKAAKEAAAVEEAARKAAEAAKKAAETPAVIIQTLSDQRNQDLDKAMRKGTASAVISKAVGGYELRKVVFDRVLATPNGPGSWLNDEAMNAWFEAIVQRKKEQTGWAKGKVPAFAAFNTSWWVNVTKDGVQKIKTWSRRQQISKEGLLKCERLFMPLNYGGSHWTLLIISGTDRTIQYFDSNLGTGKRVIEIAHKFLEQELGDKYKPDEWQELPNESGQQANNNDCGVFSCFNGLASAKNMDYGLVDASGMKDARRMMAAVLQNEGFTKEFEL